MPVQKFPADATAVSAPKNRQIASYWQEKPVADIRSTQADMRPFSWQLGTAARATHLYDLYHPVEDLMEPRPPLKRTPEELDAYLGGLVEDIEP